MNSEKRNIILGFTAIGIGFMSAGYLMVFDNINNPTSSNIVTVVIVTTIPFLFILLASLALFERNKRTS